MQSVYPPVFGKYAIYLAISQGILALLYEGIVEGRVDYIALAIVCICLLLVIRVIVKRRKEENVSH